MFLLQIWEQATENGVFYKGSAEIAKNSVKWLSRTGNYLGFLSTGYSATKFAMNPNWGDGIDTSVGVGSYFFWEIGAAYYLGKLQFDYNREQIKKNILNDKDPLEGIYNPSQMY